MNRVYTFNNVLTEYTEIGKLDERSGKKTAITNIMLHPEKDSKIIDELMTIFKAYTGMTSNASVASKFFRMVENQSSDFYGYYKLKVRRQFFYNKGLKKWTPSNIKGEFHKDVIEKSYVRDWDTKKLVPVKPNYTLFVHDCAGEKPVCYTDRIRAYEDGFVNSADVQVVVEKFGKNGIQLTLFKYRRLAMINMESSNIIKQEENVPDSYDDGLDHLFNTFDESILEDKTESDNGDDIEFDEDVFF